jgi:hypothetical protein
VPPPGSGGDSTNNLAERLLRFGVRRRKRSQGSRADNGLQFVAVERILSVKKTMIIQKKSNFSLLIEAITRFFQISPCGSQFRFYLSTVADLQV